MSDFQTIKTGADTILSEDDLRKKLSAGRPLRIKLGVDPTRPDLTLGHAVVFQKLRQFQDLGHQAQLVIGDFTTLIGDPSGRSSTRPQLTHEEIQENATTYMEQAFRVLDREKTVVRHNSEWFGKMKFEDVLALARKMTVARMLERDDFANRYKEGKPISLVEFLYPLVQGYDSVELQSDVELGGTDQLFNMLVGRQLQKDAGQEEQVVICMPLLVGLDGVNKMSKSLGNYVAFNDSPRDMFGKIMSLGDDQMWDYYLLVLNASPETIETLKTLHPMEAKKRLAEQITGRFHSPEDGRREREQFEQVFSRKEIPDEMPSFSRDQISDNPKASLLQLLTGSGLFPSNKEARRLIMQGAVKVDGVKWIDPDQPVHTPGKETVIQAGKRIFFRIGP